MTDLRDARSSDGGLDAAAAPILVVAATEFEGATFVPPDGVEANIFVPVREEGTPLERTHRLAESIVTAAREGRVRTVVLPTATEGGVADEDASDEGAAERDRQALAVAGAAAARHVFDLDRLEGRTDGLQRVVFLDVGGDFEAVDAERAYEHVHARLRAPGPTVTAVVSAWNKHDDVRANLLALRAQTRPFDEIVVVDNASTDGTPDMIRREFPEVRLVVMPNADYGACETFNVGFSTAGSDMIAILDDDVVLTPPWLERTLARMQAEPATTAVVSTKVVEPGMPESYASAPAVNTERYMSTFRGCASLARKASLAEAGYYDERLFLYGNERDLTCRLLNLGYRVLQYPGAETFHMTPFGLKMGKRSLYFHARNAWLSMLKYAPLKDLARMPWLVLSKVLLRGSKAEAEGAVTDAVGTIGIGRAVRETPGAWWVLAKASFSILRNVPYCLRHRQPVHHADFDLPLS